MGLTVPERRARHPREGAAQADQPFDFEDFFHQNWERVCSVAFYLVGERLEAEDIALEAFLRLYRLHPKRGDNLVGWVCRVATNLGYNALRAEKRRQRYERGAGQEAWDRRTAPDPADAVDESDRSDRVQMALARIEQRSAHMLVLRYSGFSYAEIADALQVSPTSVGTLLARAERDFEREYRRLEGE